MSQSDYLKYKKTATILKDASGVPAILESQDYTSYKFYSLGNSISSKNKTLDQLVPSGSKIIFGIEHAKTASCPTFTLCNNTDQRFNREKVTTFYDTVKGLPFVTPLPEYVKQPTWAKTACYCILDSSYTDANLCKCKTRYYK
jgi:hypothetical protein